MNAYVVNLLLLVVASGLFMSSAVLHTVSRLFSGSAHTCVFLDDKTIKCWGIGFSGQLGHGENGPLGDGSNEMGDFLPTVDLGSELTALQLSNGGSHTCAVLDNATVKCWGYGFHGQLGYGDSESRGNGPNEMGDLLPTVDLGTGRTALEVSTGGSHTCAVLDNATVKCWGLGFFGQLGHGVGEIRGDEPEEMGDFLPTVNLGTGRTAVQIAIGDRHTCAILDNAAVKCWGLGTKGRLGYGDGQTRGDGPNEMGDNLPTVDLGTGRTALQLSCGGSHTCAVLDDRTIKCWGLATTGRLGYGDSEDRGDESEEMGDDLPTVDLGTGRTAVQVSTGDFHTCTLLDDSTIKCWGEGINGQLGYGDNRTRGVGPNEMGDSLPTVDLGTGRTALQVSTGGSHTCALLDDATVKCWGFGTKGRLGYGDTLSRGDEPDEMGDFLPAVDLGSIPTSSPTASPTRPTSTPTASPTRPTASPTASPTRPTASPTTSSPTASPSLQGATTFVGQTLLFDNENGGGNAWTDEEIRALEAEDVETLEQACLVSQSALRTGVGFTLGRTIIFRTLFNCDAVPTPFPTARSQESGLSTDAIIAIATTVVGVVATLLGCAYVEWRQKPIQVEAAQNHMETEVETDEETTEQ